MVHLAPRVSETRSLSGKITPELIGEKTIWIWSVVGKGGTEEDLPVPVHVMDELARFRQALDLNPLPGPDDHVPLFPSFRRMKADGSFSDISDPLTRSSVYKRITEHIIPRAKDLAKRRGVSDARLDLVSPHWFRHTALTEILRKSNDLQVAKKLGRHRDINTTAGYTQADLITLHEAMED